MISKLRFDYYDDYYYYCKSCMEMYTKDAWIIGLESNRWPQNQTSEWNTNRIVRCQKIPTPTTRIQKLWLPTGWQYLCKVVTSQLCSHRPQLHPQHRQGWNRGMVGEFLAKPRESWLESVFRQRVNVGAATVDNMNTSVVFFLVSFLNITTTDAPICNLSIHSHCQVSPDDLEFLSF